jgi:hypothetical protein
MFDVSRRLPAGRILDFDIENRPLAYWFDDRTTGEITAIGWAFYDDPVVISKLLKPPPSHEKSMLKMLLSFRRVYDEAVMVTGHYIRRHDLPIINAHMIEFGLPPLGPKMTSDTKLDLIKTAQFSASQLALSKILEVDAEKPRMTVARWRDANRLTPEGRAAARERVEGDVKQHMEMRAALLREGLLGPPRMWTP